MKLLLVEDEEKLGSAIKRGLEQEGFAVDWEKTAESAEAAAGASEYDVIILDRMLPNNRDGLEVCRQLREEGVKSPVLMLTAMGEVDDRVAGLNSGADDYLVKPFDFSELVARVRALLRRPTNTLSPDIKVGQLVIHSAQKKVTSSGKKVSLSRREYALLEYLATHSQKVHSKDDLIEHVWDFDADILPNTVEVFIRSLRKKLDKAGEPSVIETVRGFGYRLSGVQK